ncbi:uncharacterized protein LOC131970307 [Centropristis striata]|uniref:uncharacterized protein LOC131970307 n=1 Tax=Centropristis striata TaxID=184440 RepID=UPI0027E02EAD|nr:uncharacterized protein LOC131970307 [Centropristis striata]
MNMQNPNAAADRTQKTVIPEVRYHPSIQINAPAAKTRTSQTQRTRPAAVRPPQTGTDRKILQVNPSPAVKLPPDGGQNQEQSTLKPMNKPEQRTPKTMKKQEQRTLKPTNKLVQRAAADPDPARVPVRPQEVPPGLGVQLDQCVVDQVEVLTRGQSTNQDWFAWRKNRITASVAHRIARSGFVNGKSTTPPTSYLAAIMGEGPRVQTRAMSWGIQKEAQVVRIYQRMKSNALGHKVSVRDCGLFIDARRSWLAASPDGIVTDSRTGQWLLCLEVKCPYKHKDRRVEDACRDDPAFCLEIQDEDGQEPGGSLVYRLKTSHCYYTQIQVQLAVTGLRRADLAVFTLKETAIVPVTFDPDLWEETLSKLEMFYRDAVVPHIKQKRQQDAAAAWTREL